MDVAAPEEADRRKMDLALNLIDQYLAFVQHWQWGDSILEWIRQCETTFETRIDLRNLLRADVWPHAGRASFVTLLEDKDVETGGVGIEKAVGMRLTFRQAAAAQVFLESVPVLSERDGRQYSVFHLGRHESGAGKRAAAGAIHHQRRRHELAVGQPVFPAVSPRA